MRCLTQSAMCLLLHMQECHSNIYMVNGLQQSSIVQCLAVSTASRGRIYESEMTFREEARQGLFGKVFQALSS